MLLSDDQELADHARFLSTQAREPGPVYEHRHVGYNYRMSNILAAVGRAQLARLDAMIARRRQIRERYAEVADRYDGVTVFQRQGDAEDNCWLTSLLIDPDVAPVKAADVITGLEDQDIEGRALWNPMHRQPVYADAASYLNGTSDRLFARGVTLPSGSIHSDEAIDRVCVALDDILGAKP
jgi:dTDP-4-amino-4,6-dideoxygalactose transaminase